MNTYEAGVIGAGPYGLTAAAHLRAAGVSTAVFGEVMSFWHEMPKGMLLRSEWDGSHLSDPAGSFSLDAYHRAEPNRLSAHITMPEFAAYGGWFQRNAAPDVDPRLVRLVERTPGGFRFTLSDGDQVDVRRAIVATGLKAFARGVPALADLPPGRAPHSSEERDFSLYAGQRVLVIGAGQAALESAALLNDAGAEVELVTRQRHIHWLAGVGHISRESGRMARLLYPPGAVGPIGVNWAVQLPGLYRALPDGFQQKVFARALRPAGSGWLRERFDGVFVMTGRKITSATVKNGAILVELSSGSPRVVDHIVQATGFRVSVDGYNFLSPEIRRALRDVAGQPALGPGFESSVPGLHFAGGAADLSFGPLMRFVAGTGYAAKSIAKSVTRGARVPRRVVTLPAASPAR